MSTLQLEVVTPDKTVVSAEVDMTVCPGVMGEFGVLPLPMYDPDLQDGYRTGGGQKVHRLQKEVPRQRQQTLFKIHIF